MVDPGLRLRDRETHYIGCRGGGGVGGVLWKSWETAKYLFKDDILPFFLYSLPCATDCG
jgi:hypothetical protein